MALPVVSGAAILCTMGLAPGTLTAACPVTMGGGPCVTIADTAPLINVGSCGMCTSMANPTVAAATAAALGVLTPMPCIPSPVGTWVCPPGTMIGGKPALSNEGTLACAYAGSISILSAGQGQVLY